jgi:hypothetical protein
MSPKALKRSKKMTREIIPAFEGQVVNSHSLTVRLDQLEGGEINYTVIPDEEVIEGADLGLAHHLAMGAPMTYLGIIVLGSKLMNQVIVETLDTVNEGLHFAARMANEAEEEVDEPGQLAMEEMVLH